MEEPEVMELVEYCRELEDLVIENNQVVDQTVILKQLISEISKSCSDLLEKDKEGERWENEFERVDFKETVTNLKNYITKYCLDNKIYL
jgi:hypothetical protein